MPLVPDGFLELFFEAATKDLEELDLEEEFKSLGNNITLSDCRNCLVGQQEKVLSRALEEYNQREKSCISFTSARERLENLNDVSLRVEDARKVFESTARQALCKMVLYAETHRKDEMPTRELQKDGILDRNKLLDFIALCETAISMPPVKKYLVDGSPMFDDLGKVAEERTAMKFPQARLEKIQSHFSEAVGWDPEFTAIELRKLFMVSSPSEYSGDQEILRLFQQLVVQMHQAVADASLGARHQPLCDRDQGGVTRVIAVQHSEVSVPQSDAAMSTSIAPSRKTIDPQLTENEQKRQIRIASEAARLQDGIIQDLLAMQEQVRDRKLAEAKDASDRFIATIESLPPGRDRISYLQSVDSYTSSLLAMHKVWSAYLASQMSDTIKY